MVSDINLTTGPVHISKEVMRAFTEPPVSHRSPMYLKLHEEVSHFLNEAFSTRENFILSGSGTLANEAMLQEIKYLDAPGLILSNGEFGGRLADQAKRNNLQFTELAIPWGLPFDLQAIEQSITSTSPGWVLFCHCETSTGIRTDLDKLVGLGKKYNFLCFVDCMSSAGTRPLDLSGVAMATASSGKGLAALPGIALVFSNIDVVSKQYVPTYLDLAHYRSKGGIPFTISSNGLHALHTAVHQKLQPAQFALMQELYDNVYRLLEGLSLAPFSDPETCVFTIVPSPGYQASPGLNDFTLQGLQLSNESEYLKKRGWSQLALFGYYTKAETLAILTRLRALSQKSQLTPTNQE